MIIKSSNKTSSRVLFTTLKSNTLIVSFLMRCIVAIFDSHDENLIPHILQLG